ncbi:MAG: hypothetical protein P1U37_15590 [Minwuia sp.]|nr:hypothetical protein [Minwuia sp.]
MVFGMVRIRSFRLTLTALTVLAMLFSTGFGVSAMCGLADQSSAAPAAPAAHAEHAGMVDSQLDTASGQMSDSGMACDMCVGDGGCDHGICTPGIAASAVVDGSRVSGSHDASHLPQLNSSAMGHQPPPPRAVS